MKTSKYSRRVGISASLQFYGFKIFLLLFLSGISFAQTTQEINLVDQYGGYINQIANSNQDLFICQSHAFRIADLFNNQPKVYSTTLLPWEGWEAFADETMAFVSKQNMIMSINFSNLSNIITSPVVSLGQNNAETITSIFANSQYVFTTQYNSNTKTGTFRILNRNDLSEAGSVDIVCQQVQVVGSTAYVVTGHLSMGISTTKLRAYNISNPSNITELGSILEGCKRVQVAGNYAYVVGNGIFGLAIVDVTNPANMTIKTAGKGPTTSLQFINVLGNYAYASSYTDFFSIDISNKANPIQIGSVNLGSSVIMEQIIYPNVQQFLRAFLIQSGEIQILDISTPANIVKLNPFDSPSSVDCIEYYQDNIFIGDGSKIWKCPVNNLHVDNHYLDADNKFIRAQDGVLYIASDNGNKGRLTLYDISDLNNPVKKGEYQTDYNINKFEVFKKNAYLIFQNTASLDIINCTDPNNLQKISSFQIGGNGKEIFIPASNQDKLVYVGYYNSNTGLMETAVINVTNTAAPSLVSKTPTHGIPYAVYVDNNTLYAGGTSVDAREWFLQAFDITNKQAPTLLAQLAVQGTVAGEVLYDMFAKNDKLVVTLNKIGIRTYELIRSSSGSILKKTNRISLDPSFSQTGENTEVTFARNLLTYPFGSDLYGYSNGSAWGYDHGTKGIFKFKIPDFFPPISDKVNLTMSIKPAEAVNHGCNTIPAPGGPYEYNKDDIVQLMAMDNPPEGWCFKEWTGDASGNSKNANVVMDKDKHVTANFVEVKLTVSGSAVEEAVCPAAANLTSKNKLLPIVLCASPASGWAVQGITFKTSGTGDMLKDVWALKVYKGTEIIAIGSLEPVRNAAESHVSFSPPLIVPANECVTLRLCYIFVYDETTYAIDTTYTFLVETKNVNATPLEYPEGLIEGKAKRNGPFTIARIYNEWGIGFSKIQDAVNSEFTQDGSTCYLCDGVYTENVLINEKSKEVTVTSVNGKEKTFIKRKDPDKDAFKIDGKYNIKIKSLTFEGTKEGGGNGIAVFRSGPVTITENTIKNFKMGVVLGSKTKNSTVEGNLFDSNEKGAVFINAESNIFQSNTFSNSIPNQPDLSIIGGKQNNVYENSIISPDGRFTIILLNTQLNRIYSNDSYLPIGLAKYSSIILEDAHQNEIYKNLCYQIEAKNSNSNKVENNELLKLEMMYSETNDIIKNNITGKDRIKYDGISLSFSNKNFISQNKIYENHLDGINLGFSSDVLISKNTISHNRLSGVKLSDCKNASVIKNTVSDNNENGVEISGSNNTELTENKITGHNKEYREGGEDKDAAGVDIFDSHTAYVYRNILKENCTAILSRYSDGVNISSNEISNNLCLFTGIHLENSNAEIFGNSIINNEGNGVFFSNNSKGTVRENNIFGNAEFGVNNSDASVTINAQNNWWGRDTGPEPTDVSGNFIVSSWLSEPLSLFCNAARDTIYTSAGKTDSSLVHFQNFKFPDDVLDITISDEKGWITSPASFTSQMKDSMGTSANIIFNIHADVDEGIINKVMIVARSKSEVSVSVKDSLYISVYKQLLKEMSITPDSATIAVGDSLRFSAYGYDQHGNNVKIYPKWQTTLGQINSQGLFKCSSSGKAIITVTDSLSGLVAKAVIIVGDIVSVEGEKDIPTIYNLFQNYPNPFNPATTIKYSLPQSAYVDLSIYNLLGEKITTLIRKEQSAGLYSVTWNARNYSSGVYIYVLRVNQKIFVNKMVMLK